MSEKYKEEPYKGSKEKSKKGSVRVHGYKRSDGTVVHGYNRKVGVRPPPKAKKVQNKKKKH